MEERDEFDVCKNISPREMVKSNAVVKFSAVQVPVKFNRLEMNTNLNLPPSNWLTTSDNTYGLHQALYHNPGLFASFRMTHMFPDCVGDVDVISDAENMKKLLKLPYTSKGTISMIVHKIGNTLLLDEFDAQKYLLRETDDDWKWLRTFILEQIVAFGEKEHNFCLKDKSREALRNKNLLSKFLYYSLKQSSVESSTQDQQTQSKNPPHLPITGPVLPEPKVEENVPDPKSSHAFNRNVLWTFEDIRMLIGTDMPIFGGPNRPCISLRLRDMTKPINVLTGIDYWLDNLMCNVPEVVMCYHLDGIVQKYEIIKTEDLPFLENSQFSPQVVRNVAQNILAFLKANATKSGHTYWLFKRRNDDVVKLYDLTTLCENQAGSNSCHDDKQDNPFTVPVAMLLYTVARNMKNTSKVLTSKTAGSIRALLNNCIQLLPKEKYPQIVTSSHYILSDLHIPTGIDPKSPNFDFVENDSDVQSVYEDEEEEDDSSCSDIEFNFGELAKELDESIVEKDENVAMKNICDTLKDFKLEKNYKNCKHGARAPSPLQASIEDRCLTSLEHISAGFVCLQFSNINEENILKESEERAKDEEKQRILHEEQNPNMARPFKPIPLPYETICEVQSSHGEKFVPDCRSEILKSSCEMRELKNKSKLKQKKNRDLKDCRESREQHELTNNCQQQQQVATSFNTQLFGSWNMHLKLLLIEKACLTYATLAEHSYVELKYGSSLKSFYMSIRCQQVVTKYMPSIVSQKSCLLGRAGDCFFQMAKNWNNIDEYLTQYNEIDEHEEKIYNELKKDIEIDFAYGIIKPLKNMEHLMVSCCSCYENAIRSIKKADMIEVDGMENDTHELYRRLGNVCNELGIKYMFWAQEEYNKMMETFEKDVDDTSTNEVNLPELIAEDSIYFTLAMKSYDCLLRGIAAFSEIKDNVNLAFLYCNMGRYMRFRAHISSPDANVHVDQNLKRFYNEAFMNYERAKSIICSRKCNPDFWDLVNWELSTATFTLAKQLQDFNTLETKSKTELEKEVLELLQKALKFCDIDHSGSRQILYTYRAGLIHKRIASLYHCQIRNNLGEISCLSKTSLQLCKINYEKATNILESLKEYKDHLAVQLELISLMEFLAGNSNNATQKIKHLKTALDVCLSSQSVFEHSKLGHCSFESVTNSTLFPNIKCPCSFSTNDTDMFYEHMMLFGNRLQFVLKTLIKLLISGKGHRKLSDLYKSMYMKTLTVNFGKVLEEKSIEKLAEYLHSLLVELNRMHEHSVVD